MKPKISDKAKEMMGIEDRTIKNKHIAANSCAPSHEPSHCRFNNPSSCWKPCAQSSKLNNSWISVDLRRETKVSKLRIQGDAGNQSYVKSIRIDYSEDATTWKCYNVCGEINCEPTESEKRSPLRSPEPTVSPMAADHLSKTDKFAEIHLWPPIIARYIRIRPIEYHNEIAMRFEFYGPPLGDITNFARVIEFGELSKTD